MNQNDCSGKTLKPWPVLLDHYKSDTGVSETNKTAGSKPSTVDELGKSWSSLKKSIGEVVDAASDGITSSFESAMNTVLSPVADVVGSASKNASELAKNITKNSTGGAL